MSISLREFNRRLGQLAELLEAEDVDRIPTPELAEQITALFRLIDRLKLIRADLELSARN